MIGFGVSDRYLSYEQPHTQLLNDACFIIDQAQEMLALGTDSVLFGD